MLREFFEGHVDIDDVRRWVEENRGLYRIRDSVLDVKEMLSVYDRWFEKRVLSEVLWVYDNRDWLFEKKNLFRCGDEWSLELRNRFLMDEVAGWYKLGLMPNNNVSSLFLSDVSGNRSLLEDDLVHPDRWGVREAYEADVNELYPEKFVWGRETVGVSGVMWIGECEVRDDPDLGYVNMGVLMPKSMSLMWNDNLLVLRLLLLRKMTMMYGWDDGYIRESVDVLKKYGEFHGSGFVEHLLLLSDGVFHYPEFKILAK